jgi:hypothetical protein
MLYYAMSKLFTPKVPESYMRMIRNEFRSVAPDYIEYFLKKNKRLPTTQELLNAI